MINQKCQRGSFWVFRKQAKQSGAKRRAAERHDSKQPAQQRNNIRQHEKQRVVGLALGPSRVGIGVGINASAPRVKQ